jgi:hypothetical protein
MRAIPLLCTLVAGCSAKQTAPPDAGRTPANGTIEITSSPSGAAVLIDDSDQRLGVTPLILERPGGTGLRLLIVKDGYGSRRSYAFFEDGNRLRTHVTLTRARAVLVVRAGALRSAAVAVNGRPAGYTPLRVDVDAGVELEVEVTKPGFEPFRRKLRLAQGESRDLDAELVPLGLKGPRLGRLAVTAPEPAMVSVDGRLLGMTPVEGVALRPGSYRLEAKGRKRSWRRTVVVRSEQLTTVALP